jgi:hypothetical protein
MPGEGIVLRSSIRVLALTGAATALIVLLPGSAGAAALTNPTSLNFGSQPVGTTSAPQAVTVTAPCSVYIAPTCLTFATDGLTVNLATTGDFAIPSSNCPATLVPGGLDSAVSCSLAVAFKPTAAGTRTGTLSTGTQGLVPTAGPTVALTGTGTASTSTSGAGTTITPQRKKCKKHHKHRRHGRKCRKTKRQ